MPTLLTFAVAVFLLALTPGPSSFLVLQQTLRGGRSRALATIAGNALGILCWAGSAAIGLSTLVAASHLAYDVLRFAGAIVLIWLGVQSLLRARRSSSEPEQHAPGTRPAGVLGAFRDGLVTSLANPKAAVFTVALLPQFVSVEAAGVVTFALFAVVWATVSSLWYTTLALLVNRIRTVITRATVRRRLEQTSGAVLVTLGLRLAVDSR